MTEKEEVGYLLHDLSRMQKHHQQISRVHKIFTLITIALAFSFITYFLMNAYPFQAYESGFGLGAPWHLVITWVLATKSYGSPDTYAYLFFYLFVSGVRIASHIRVHKFYARIDFLLSSPHLREYFSTLPIQEINDSGYMPRKGTRLTSNIQTR